MKSFTVSSDSLVVKDPCYEGEMNIIPKIVKGTWLVEPTYCDDKLFCRAGRGRVAEIAIYHEKYYGSLSSKSWKKEPFIVHVDSGQAGFVDYKDHDKTHEELYDDICSQTLTSESYGVIKSGAFSSSGYGDGSYECFVKTDDEKNVVAAKIVFIDTEEE